MNKTQEGEPELKTYRVRFDYGMSQYAGTRTTTTLWSHERTFGECVNELEAIARFWIRLNVWTDANSIDVSRLRSIRIVSIEEVRGTSVPLGVE